MGVAKANFWRGGKSNLPTKKTSLKANFLHFFRRQVNLRGPDEKGSRAASGPQAVVWRPPTLNESLVESETSRNSSQQ